MINLVNKEPRIEVLKEKKLVGKSLQMSFAENKTVELWKSFMPFRNEIQNTNGSNLYSMQLFEPGFFEMFSPLNKFEKRAAIEVRNFDSVPAEIDKFILPGGLYAVFRYRGKASEAAETFGYIYYSWLPNSDYILDDRPHFEILGEKYKNDHPDSEEEIWIPVRMRT